jgi:general secretion pathway protein D
MTNLPALYYRLLKNDTNTRILASPQLRTMEGTPAQARFGERIPVPVTTFSPIAQGGVNQQPITSYNYENIGVNIDITPRTHHDDEVSLALRISVQSISGTGFADLPTFGNREINTVIRLRDGETNMLAGLIRDDERRVIEGVPGLIDVPVLGRLFAHSRTEVTQSDIILTLTPHLVRILDLDEADLRAFRVGRDSVTPLSDIALPIELRPQIETPPPATPAPPPGAPPVTPAFPGATPPAVPIEPPAPAPPTPPR